jgi:hypothetical protein
VFIRAIRGKTLLIVAARNSWGCPAVLMSTSVSMTTNMSARPPFVLRLRPAKNFAANLANGFLNGRDLTISNFKFRGDRRLKLLHNQARGISLR